MARCYDGAYVKIRGIRALRHIERARETERARARYRRAARARCAVQHIVDAAVIDAIRVAGQIRHYAVFDTHAALMAAYCHFRQEH